MVTAAIVKSKKNKREREKILAEDALALVHWDWDVVLVLLVVNMTFGVQKKSYTELDWLLRRWGSSSWRQELVVDVGTAMEGGGGGASEMHRHGFPQQIVHQGTCK